MDAVINRIDNLDWQTQRTGFFLFRKRRLLMPGTGPAGIVCVIYTRNGKSNINSPIVFKLCGAICLFADNKIMKNEHYK
ncbi:hypothetical protein BDD43_1666 [Mucilaginibacter gracilis]|uniref:Uncharacterized protein n=1 Tax=Mucilaginibacter gracilis TaxID=423350 RepID=A0A495J096_9SPHI|nr:hypothetical protein BDD43_1666 [Mucilaginibacter gracilis]